MRKATVNDRVRLTREVPELSLHVGDVGVVRSIWFSPEDFCQIEFPSHETEPPDRCLVPARLVEIEEDLPKGDSHDSPN
jgi:hypothetical protein